MEGAMDEWTLVTGLLALPLAWLLALGHFRFYARYAAYVLGVSLVAFLRVPVYALRPRNVDNLIDSARYCKHITKLVGITWELRDCHYLGENQVGIIVANHQSIFDILGMFNLWETMGRCTVIARREIFWVWPFGLAAWLSGLIFIHRGNSEQAKRQLNCATSIIKAEKTKIWFFPEGTRNRLNKGTLLPFRKGAFHLAIANQVPLLPVVYSPYYFIDSKKKFFDRGNVIIKALPPISTEGLTVKDVDQLAKQTRQQMLEEYNRLSKEVLSLLPPNYPVCEK